VTVSMAADMSGTFRRIRRVTRVERFDLAWAEFPRVGRNQEDVVEGESFFENAHAQLYALGPRR